MLSIENILKDNGIKINFYMNEEFLVVRINMYKMIFLYENNLASLIEQACRQYVKENEFKLEWFDNDTRESFVENGGSDLENTIGWVTQGMIKGNGKLLCWLFANDIEIKENKNERES